MNGLGIKLASNVTLDSARKVYLAVVATTTPLLTQSANTEPLPARAVIVNFLPSANASPLRYGVKLPLPLTTRVKLVLPFVSPVPVEPPLPATVKLADKLKLLTTVSL